MNEEVPFKSSQALSPDVERKDRARGLPKSLQRLAAADAVFWSQKAAYLNTVSLGWCVINNQYKVHEWDSLSKQKGRLLFKLK